MRIGFNPQKDKVIELNDFFHQIIIPVYIPNHETYFKDSFKIFKISLQSLFKTCHKQTFFTIVNNGSCNEVIAYLNTLLYDKKINELIHTTNIGKLNAILKGVIGQNFPLVTITDADVLFLNNWQDATYKVYLTFPKTGVVSPVPNSKMVKYYTSNVFFDTLLSKTIKLSKIINPEAMLNFAKSINNPKLFSKIHLQYYLTVSKHNFKAVVGAGHFVATYNRRIFDGLNTSYSKYKMGNALQLFLDKTVVNQGYWRLSTQDNFAYHMGNRLEEWMELEVEQLKENRNLKVKRFLLGFVKTKAYKNWIRVNLFSKFIFQKRLWILFLRLKGMSKKDAKKY